MEPIYYPRQFNENKVAGYLHKSYLQQTARAHFTMYIVYGTCAFHYNKLIVVVLYLNLIDSCTISIRVYNHRASNKIP